MTPALAAALVAAVTAAPPAPWGTLSADLDGDGRAERVRVFRGPGGGFLAVADFVSAVYPLWAATAGDLDADGRAEIVLGLWTTSRRLDEPGPRRSVWVLGWQAGRLVERWRGSALARPLAGFGLADLDGDGRAELVALERRGVSVYSWTGFGFRAVARLGGPP